MFDEPLTLKVTTEKGKSAPEIQAKTKDDWGSGFREWSPRTWTFYRLRYR